MRVLVVGARPGSLGEAIANRIEWAGPNVEVVVTAGITSETLSLDLVMDSAETLRTVVRDGAFTHIVVTAGVNNLRPERNQDWPEHAETNWYLRHYAHNVVGPMRLLTEFADWVASSPEPEAPRHYVVMSSNSAHIARTGSAAYCASKAALSMAIRVRARELAEAGIVCYGYEPGLLAGTPMTVEVEKQLWRQHGSGVPMTRMRGSELTGGISVERLACMVVSNLTCGGQELNGCLFRVDAGEQ